MTRPLPQYREFVAVCTAASETLTQHLGRAPKPSELADYLAVDADAVVEALAGEEWHPRARWLSSLLPGPSEVSDEKTPGESGVESVDPAQTLKHPTDLERHLLDLRFLCGLTQTEISRALGISRTQVCHLLARARPSSPLIDRWAHVTGSLAGLEQGPTS